MKQVCNGVSYLESLFKPY